MPFPPSVVDPEKFQADPEPGSVIRHFLFEADPNPGLHHAWELTTKTNMLSSIIVTSQLIRW